MKQSPQSTAELPDSLESRNLRGVPTEFPFLSNEGLESIHQVRSHNQFGEEHTINIVDELPLTIKVDGEELVTLMTLGTHPERLKDLNHSYF